MKKRPFLFPAVFCLLLCAALLVAASGPAQAGMEPGWQVDPKTGCKAWNPNPQPNETFTWNGMCKNGYLEGKGTVQWLVDGKPTISIAGTLFAGKVYGMGVASGFSSKGEQYRYEGMFVLSNFRGRGIMTWSNGVRYEGDFRDGFRTGRGIMTWPNGDRYEGDFVDNRRTGKGAYSWANGDYYEGDFVDDLFHGNGMIRLKDGRVVRGRFIRDKYAGP